MPSADSNREVRPLFAQALEAQMHIAQWWQSPEGLERVREGSDAAFSRPHGHRTPEVWTAMIATAETFIVAADVMSLVGHAARDLPPETTVLPSDILVPRGFVLLESPGPWISAAGEEDSRLRALNWYEAREEEDGGDVVFRYLMYSDTPTRPFPYTIGYVDSGWLRLRAQQPGDVVPEYPEQLVFIKSLMLFMQSRIVKRETHRPQLDRAARRRLEGWQHRDEIQTIRLRAVDYPEGPGTSEHAGYSHRFPVRAHWRHYQDGKTVPVAGYIKGPADKPVRYHKDRLWAVVR